MTVYLDLEDLMAVAKAAVAPADVLVRDVGLLESALARPRASAFGEDAYTDIWTKGAALLESLSRNHALIDGNKRLAWVAMRYFLILNDEDVAASSPEDGDVFVRSVAQGHMTLAAVAAQLRRWSRG